FAQRRDLLRGRQNHRPIDKEYLSPSSLTLGPRSEIRTQGPSRTVRPDLSHPEAARSHKPSAQNNNRDGKVGCRDMPRALNQTPRSFPPDECRVAEFPTEPESSACNRTPFSKRSMKGRNSRSTDIFRCLPDARCFGRMRGKCPASS